MNTNNRDTRETNQVVEHQSVGVMEQDIPHGIPISSALLHDSIPPSTRSLEKAHHRVAVLHFFGFAPDVRQLQRIAFAVPKDEQPVER